MANLKHAAGCHHDSPEWPPGKGLCTCGAEQREEIAALRAQLEQAQAERDNLVFRNDSLREQTTQLLIQRDNLVIAQDWLKATIARQREWIEKAGHRPGCAITKCKAYPGCSGGQYSPVHSARHFAFEHVFIPSPCDCGWAEQVRG